MDIKGIKKLVESFGYDFSFAIYDPTKQMNVAWVPAPDDVYDPRPLLGTTPYNRVQIGDKKSKAIVSCFYVAHFPSLCGAMIFHSFADNKLDIVSSVWEAIGKSLSYTLIVCSVNNDSQREQLLKCGWNVMKEFVNRNSSRTIYLMEKQVR